MNALNKKQGNLLFLGCAIPYRVVSYEVSTRKILGGLGVELIEMPEYNCCGLPLDPVDHDMMFTLAARNLCLAERLSLNIIALCPGCAGTLKKVNTKLREDNKVKEKINKYLKKADLEFKGTIEAKHILQFLLEDVGLDTIKKSIKKPLIDIKVAEHSGCHVTRPKKDINFDNPESPEALKKLIEATGACYVEYSDRTACCGSPIAGVNDKIPLQLSREKLVNIRKSGAQVLVTVCPFCHMMFDTNQSRIERTFNEAIGIPVFHYTQLLGLAMGFSPEELALKDLRVDPSNVVSRIYREAEGDQK